MQRTQTSRQSGVVWLLASSLLLGGVSRASAQDGAAGKGDTSAASPQAAAVAKPTFEIYGFAMLDMGHDFKQIHPDWFDTMRVTKLP